MPKSNVVILTDPASHLSIQASNVMVEPIPGDYARGNLMLQRIMSYIVRAISPLIITLGRIHIFVALFYLASISIRTHINISFLLYLSY